MTCTIATSVIEGQNGLSLVSVFFFFFFLLFSFFSKLQVPTKLGSREFLLKHSIIDEAAMIFAKAGTKDLDK